MKKALIMTLAVGLLVTGVFASEPMNRLEQAFNAMAEGDNQKALQEFKWCYDHGSKTDASFNGMHIYVIEGMKLLGETYPQAIEVMKVWRDAAMSRVGVPPRITLDFFNVLALNRALNAEELNRQLLQKCEKDAGVKRFASTIIDQPVPGSPTTPEGTLAEAKVASLRLGLEAVVMQLEMATIEYKKIDNEMKLGKGHYADKEVQLDTLVKRLSSTGLTYEESQRYLAMCAVVSNEMEECGERIRILRQDMKNIDDKKLVLIKRDADKIEKEYIEAKKLKMRDKSQALATIETDLGKVKQDLSVLKTEIEKSLTEPASRWD